MKSLPLAILFILFSCNTQKKPASENSVQNQLIQEDSTMVLLLQDEYIDFETTETMVIRDQKNLKSFYAKINMTRKPGLPIPNVDFTKEMVVVHCNGKQNNIGSPTLILEAETDTTLQLISKFETNASSSERPVVTNPFCVYKLPLSGKAVKVRNDLK